MKKFSLLLFFSICCFQFSFAQTNITCTNATAQQVILGNYDATDYLPPVLTNHPDSLINGILSINADSLRSYIEILSSFQNRNTSSDTVSTVKGIGAARRWVYEKFQQFSNENNNRLLPSYLQFDTLTCGMQQHRNVFAVLPGLDDSDPSIVIVESHLDSRCEDLCDTSCVAEGADDNASGTALVIELARVFSKYSFNHTLVFLANTGEEQGLFGGRAFAQFADDNSIPIRCVLNNDIVSGVLCGHTSSPPSCSPFGDVDSTQVRLFSYGAYNSLHKSLARFIKLEYKEELLPFMNVPMLLTIMSGEDRVGRGGDHIPFRQHGFTAMRFTSANENGDADVDDTTYIDNQHTTRDVIGYDTNNDNVIDSFLIDFNYLQRNAQINAVAAAMAAIGPNTPSFTATNNGADVSVTIISQLQYNQYRIGVRSTTFDFDSVYTINGTSANIHLDTVGVFYFSVASVDSNGVESLFGGEQLLHVTGINDPGLSKGILLLPNKPNPSDEATVISVLVEQEIAFQHSLIRISDLKGNRIKEFPINLKKGLNEVLYHHGFNTSGTFIFQLIIDETVVATSKMVFTNK